MRRVRLLRLGARRFNWCYGVGNTGGPMPKLINKDALLKHMGESHDQLSKLALLLLAAHGGSLATCATILKDAASRPKVQGIAVFTLLFGVGLLASIAN